MPDSLIFDGSDDRIVIGGLPAGVGSGAITILAIVKGDTWNSYQQILAWNTIDAGLMLNNNSPENLSAGPMTGNNGTSQFTMTETGWMLIGWCKAAGTTVPTFHKYLYDTNVWNHSASVGNNPADNLPALTSMWVGESSAFPGSGFHDGNVLIFGIWNTKLPDNVVETLAFSKDAWESLAPAVGIRFDSATAISGGVFAGTATQTSRTGTTLDVGDAPTGPGGTWTDATGPTSDVIREQISIGPDKTGGSSWTDSITFPGELENTLLLVAVHSSETGDLVSGVTYNAVPLTELVQTGGTEWTSLQFWYLKNPPAGFAADLVTTLTTSATMGRQVAWFFSNVDQTNPFRDFLNNEGDGNTSSILPLAAAELGDYLVDAITIDSTGHAAVPDVHTEDYDDPVSTACDTVGSNGVAAGVSTDEMAWSWTTSVPFSHIGVAIAPAGPAASQIIRPDADVTTTGWTATPLFSKVDEAVTDDADFITSTAS